ncbi:MAG: TetR/AcrR family transcriptional regulator [Actinobacteria bacterium]|nr:TetR/AcrR family transcriptional regulator [Actinomycetota bacterium]
MSIDTIGVPDLEARSGPTTGRASARDRLLDAADELFYAEGIHTVGIDRIIERAGVAKASLYNCYGSKDELVRAYLLRRHDRRQARIQAAIARYDTPREQLLAVFDALDELLADPKFRGCAFVNAAAEGPAPDAVREVGEISRSWVHGALLSLAIQAGASDPGVLADQLVLLYDGALIGAKMDGNAATARTARAVAATLIDAIV